MKDARLLLKAISSLVGTEVSDPFTDAETLNRAVTGGLLDAPQLRNNKFGRGEIRTGIVNGANVTIGFKGKVIQEKERLLKLIEPRRIQ